MTREEAKRYILQWQQELKDGGFPIDSDKIQALRVAIEALSEQTGEWIFEETDEYKRTYCSVCGGSAPFVLVSDDYYGRRIHGETRKTKFCPNCGTRMVKKNDK